VARVLERGDVHTVSAPSENRSWSNAGARHTECATGSNGPAAHRPWKAATAAGKSPYRTISPGPRPSSGCLGWPWMNLLILPGLQASPTWHPNLCHHSATCAANGALMGTPECMLSLMCPQSWDSAYRLMRGLQSSPTGQQHSLHELLDEKASPLVKRQQSRQWEPCFGRSAIGLNFEPGLVVAEGALGTGFVVRSLQHDLLFSDGGKGGVRGLALAKKPQ
jgi:hypothetical protein